ncbi:MAG: sigma-54 dependent transcriptional regulator [Myxococcota bacterium]
MSETVANMSGAPASVAIVDDDRSHTIVLSRWLEQRSHEVESFEDITELLAASDRSDFDVIFLDRIMPNQTGPEAMPQLRRRFPDVPIVFVSVDDGTGSIVEAIQLGAYDYLTKPLDFPRLELVLSRAIEKRRLRERVGQLERTDRGLDLLGEAQTMRMLLRQLDRVAGKNITVLIRGESGSGKELVARSIHLRSPRSEGSFVALNCAAVPETLQESELFGHEKGAFTGAIDRRIGRFEAAHGGTLFLDEVAELSPGLQAKLLRVLQEREFSRVGGTKTIRSDFRLLSASHRDLREMVEEGRFRADLYYRLAVFQVEVPPLRDRSSDIPLLAERFVRDFTTEAPKRISDAALRALAEYEWPGNVRELQNAIQRASVMATGDLIRLEDLPADVAQAMGADSGQSTIDSVSATGVTPERGESRMEALERQAIVNAMEDTGGNISEVVRLLGIGRTTLYRKLKKYGLR